MRTALAEFLLDRHMAGCNRIYLRDFQGEKEISKLISFLSEDYCERLYYSKVCGSRDFGVCDGLYTPWGYNTRFFTIQLIQKMSREARQSLIQSALDRFKARARIHFEGFYIGMTRDDFCAMCVKNGRIPDVAIGEGGVNRIKFGRRTRYALFEKEDGEFWSAYLQKYVPSQKRQKSLTETIEDTLDSARFDYQEGWNDDLEEYCYIYKSMKYGTRVLFGQKTGTLVLERY